MTSLWPWPGPAGHLTQAEAEACGPGTVIIEAGHVQNVAVLYRRQQVCRFRSRRTSLPLQLHADTLAQAKIHSSIIIVFNKALWHLLFAAASLILGYPTHSSSHPCDYQYPCEAVAGTAKGIVPARRSAVLLPLHNSVDTNIPTSILGSFARVPRRSHVAESHIIEQ